MAWLRCAPARALLTESILGLLVIGATALLIHAMPPADVPAARMGARAGIPLALTPPARPRDSSDQKDPRPD